MNCTVKNDPYSDFKTIQFDLNRAFNDVFPGIFKAFEEKNVGEGPVVGKWSPSVDIYEDQQAIRLEADLPGVKADDFKLSIENYRLTLSGERKFEKPADGEKNGWQRVERGFGKFARTFTLPQTVNVEAVKAEFKDGVLVITLPKREETKPRTIQVEIKTNGTAQAPSLN